MTKEAEMLALEARLLEIANHDWRFSLLAHTSDTCREAAKTLRAAARFVSNAGLVERETLALRERLKADWRRQIEAGLMSNASIEMIVDLAEMNGLFDGYSLVRAVAGEPVAWRYKWRRGVDWFYQSTPPLVEADDAGMEILQPLYATPAPSDRQTFTVPDGHEAVRDAEGRATGEVRRIEGRDPATIVAWKAGRDAALEVIQAVRHAGAANFSDARYAGQRGVDHADALFDAYKAVKVLVAPAVTEGL